MCDAKINHQELDNINNGFVEKTRKYWVLFESENTCLNTVQKLVIIEIEAYYWGFSVKSQRASLIQSEEEVLMEVPPYTNPDFSYPFWR